MNLHFHLMSTLLCWHFFNCPYELSSFTKCDIFPDNNMVKQELSSFRYGMLTYFNGVYSFSTQKGLNCSNHGWQYNSIAALSETNCYNHCNLIMPYKQDDLTLGSYCLGKLPKQVMFVLYKTCNFSKQQLPNVRFHIEYVPQIMHTVYTFSCPL